MNRISCIHSLQFWKSCSDTRLFDTLHLPNDTQSEKSIDSLHTNVVAQKSKYERKIIPKTPTKTVFCVKHDRYFQLSWYGMCKIKMYDYMIKDPDTHFVSVDLFIVLCRIIYRIWFISVPVIEMFYTITP
jgi:hypothetical protein